MSTITIPAPLVEEVREAAQSDLSKTAREIADQAERKEPELEQLLADFDAQRGLLEAVGTLGTDEGVAVELGIEHVEALGESLLDHARTLDDAAKGARDTHRVAEADHYHAKLDALLEFIKDTNRTLETVKAGSAS